MNYNIEKLSVLLIDKKNIDKNATEISIISYNTALKSKNCLQACKFSILKFI